MGTSKSMPTPSGGKWKNVKGEISSFLSGNGTVTPAQIINSTIAAAGGLPLRSPGSNIGGESSGYGGAGGGASTSGAPRGGRIARSSVARAVSGLGGFGAALGAGNLGQALAALGIEDLRGKPAGEVISRISEHLAKDLSGLERDVIRSAVQQAIYNAAELTGDPTYENIEASLQTFLARDGVEGLIELLLTQYVFDRVWLLIEDHVNKRTDSVADVTSMEAAIEQACRSNVHEEIDRQKQNHVFERLDWFGGDGIRVAQDIVADLEQRLRHAGQGGAQ